MSQGRSGSAVRTRRVVTPATEVPGPLGSEQVRRRVIRLLVLGQAALIAGVVVPLGPVLWHGVATPGRWLVAAGGVLVLLGVVGLGRDLRISPVPARGGRLRRRGIYAFVRHPMYLGVALVAVGVTLATGRLLALVSTVLLLVLLSLKARVEGLILQRKFGWEFAVYAMRVPAIVPQPWRSHRS